MIFKFEIMLQIMVLALVNAQSGDIGYWDFAGDTGAVCVHTLLLPNVKLLCVERAHTIPYPPNPHTMADLATEISSSSC